MPKVLFTHSYFYKLDAKQWRFKQPYPPLATILAAAVVRNSGFETYLFDQQFSHPGWSGIVSTIEDEPHTLLDSRKISLKEVIIFELLLELDAVDYALGEGWSPLGSVLEKRPEDLFAPVPISEEQEILSIWQEAFEWTYFDDVLAGIGWRQDQNGMDRRIGQ